jgi:hypothetical protein
MTPLLKRVAAVASLACGISIVGLSLLGSRYEPIGLWLAVYPSSLIFYVIPNRFLGAVPEAWLFFVGLISSVAFWTSIFLAGRRAIRQVRRAA